MSRRSVTVTAERGKKWWVLEAPEAGAVSQVKRLAEADAEMREAIAYQLGISEDDFDIDLQIIVPAAAREHLEAADRFRSAAVDAQRSAAAEARAAARELADAGLPLREVGEVLGISHQRAHQLVQEARSA